MRASLVSSALIAVVAVTPVHAQSLLYRSPNLSGNWVPDAGVVQFNFLHRFNVSPAPARAITNFPTFTFAAGLGGRLGIGYRFATKSGIASGSSTNESELFARWRLLGRREGSEGVHAAITPAYNLKAKSFDGEIGADYTVGSFTILGALRELSKPFGASGAQAALAGGAVIRLNQYIALAGDYAKLLGGDTTAAWSAGIHVLIPGSPHTFALEVSNVGSNTFQGSSRGLNLGSIRRLYGFEFTIPLHLSRFGPWFHSTRTASRALGVSGRAAVEVEAAGFKFSIDTVRVEARQIVRWTNHDPVAHTVTFDGEGPPSGPLPAGGSYAVKLEQAGVYTYHCTPHPFMKGVVLVR